jgi:hypothetical protein
MIIGKSISDLSKPYNFYFDRTVSSEELQPQLDNYKNILKKNIKKSIKEIYDKLELNKYNIMDEINSAINDCAENIVDDLIDNKFNHGPNIICVNITNDIFYGIKIICVTIINKLFANTSNNIRIECVLEEQSISFEIYAYRKINIENKKISLHEFTSILDQHNTKFYLIDNVCNLYDHLKYDSLVMDNIELINTTLINKFPGNNSYAPSINNFIKITIDSSRPRDLTNISEERLINILDQFS